MPCVDGFVVFENIFADYSEFLSVQVGAQIIDCPVGPVLSVPVFGGAIDLCSRWDWSIKEFFPLFFEISLSIEANV